MRDFAARRQLFRHDRVDRGRANPCEPIYDEMTTTDHRQTRLAHNRSSCNYYSRTSLSRALGRSRDSSARIDIPPPRLIPAICSEDRLIPRERERERVRSSGDNTPFGQRVRVAGSAASPLKTRFNCSMAGRWSRKNVGDSQRTSERYVSFLSALQTERPPSKWLISHRLRRCESQSDRLRTFLRRRLLPYVSCVSKINECIGET